MDNFKFINDDTHEIWKMSQTVKSAIQFRQILRWKRRSLGRKGFQVRLILILIRSIGWHNSVMEKLLNRHFFSGVAK